ncbi:hypothetical protein Leryth_002851 [Lithospermum erythrorhizon]|uniref:Transmembrane protein n=1 Tax=Lithospermum erythrorhizon TaxID=34254 RepID=A0AAV3P2T5_LITER|nr:hypothetical protein Leryth_002851 [Lithospermum erythrorhizon]
MKYAPSLVLFVTLFLLSIARAQDRAPHGLVYESPLAFPPQAYDFFHPNAHAHSAKTPLVEDSGAPWPLAATVQSNVAHESVSTANADHETRLGAGGIAGIVLGTASVVISAIGVYYVVIIRRNNLNRTKSANPAPVQTV